MTFLITCWIGALRELAKKTNKQTNKKKLCQSKKLAGTTWDIVTTHCARDAFALFWK